MKIEASSKRLAWRIVALNATSERDFWRLEGGDITRVRLAPTLDPRPVRTTNYYTRSRAKIEDLVEFSLAAAQLNNAPASISVGVVKLPSVI